MFRNQLLSERLREVFLNGHWIANTNYKRLLDGVTLREATQKIDNLNSIAALIFHVNYYLDGILRVFETGRLEISDKYSFDMPPLQSEKDWNGLVQTFLTNAEQLAERVAQMDEAIFDQPFVEEKYGTWLRNMEGVIEHSYYHLGQVSLLRKWIGGQEA